jgi:hypothetical protein
MVRSKTVGAISFPAFLLFWSLGLLLVVGQFDSADASSARTAILVNTPLAEPARLDDSDALSHEMSRALRASEVFSGQWTPDDAEAKVAKATEPVTVATVVEPTGGLAQAEGEKSASDHSADAEEHIDKVVSAIRVVRMSSDSERSVETKEKTASAVAEGFRKTASVSVVRKTRPGANLALASLKQDARRLIRRGHIPQAFHLLRASVERGRNDSEYLGLLAVSALRSGNAAEASVVYERLLEMQPESERWWAGFALAKEQQGMDATSVFQQLLALSDENSDLKRLVRQKIGAFG